MTGTASSVTWQSGSGDSRVIRRREEWAGAIRSPVGPLSTEDVRFLLVHHTAGVTQYAENSVPGQLRGIFDFHTSPAKGWPDVCYNFFIDRFGGIWEGRHGSIDGPVTADATGGSQGFAQLVCLLGNYQDNLPDPVMIESCAWLLAVLADRYGIDTRPGVTVEFESRGSNRWPAGETVTARTISGHREMSATLCPGDNVQILLDSALPQQVNGFRSSSPTSTSSTSSSTSPDITSPSTTTGEPGATDFHGDPSSASETAVGDPTSTAYSSTTTTSESLKPVTTTNEHLPLTTDAGADTESTNSRVTRSEIGPLVALGAAALFVAGLSVRWFRPLGDSRGRTHRRDDDARYRNQDCGGDESDDADRGGLSWVKNRDNAGGNGDNGRRGSEPGGRPPLTNGTDDTDS